MKRATTVKIEEDLKRKAKENKLNMSKLLEDKIKEALSNSKDTMPESGDEPKARAHNPQICGSNPHPATDFIFI